VERRGDSPPFFYQTRILLPRSAKRITRSYLTKTATAMHLSLAVVWGFIYWHVGSDMPRRLTDFVGAIFFIVAHWSWTPLFQGLNNFPKEKEMLTKEKASRTYDIGAYFWAQTIAEAPILLVYPFMFFLIIWPMSTLPMCEALQTFFLVAVNIQACSAMSMLISAVCMDQDLSVTVAIIVMVFQMCAGGYFADMRMLPGWIGWVRYTSLYYYAFGSSLRLLIAIPYGEDVHQQAIAKYSFSELGFAWDILSMLAMSAVFRAFAYVQLRFSKKLKFS
jgi:ATP-binding cassette subfamily G (WHITE) protein 2